MIKEEQQKEKDKKKDMCLFQFWFPRCVCPAVGLLGHKAVLFEIF